MFFSKYKRRIMLVGIDLGLLVGVYFFAYALSGTISELTQYLLNFLIFSSIIFLLRGVLRVYNNVWRYANSRAYLCIVIADVVGGITALILSSIIGTAVRLGGWHSVAIVAMFTTATLVTRFIYQQIHKMHGTGTADNKIIVAIVGAGQVGALLAEELLFFHGSHYRPVCFIDRNIEKVGKLVAGIPVYGEDDEVFDRLESLSVQEIIIAIPQLSGDDVKEILEYYGKTGCKVKLYDFASNEGTGETDKRVIREFKIEDLLFRRTIDVINDDTREFYSDKVVLVTGGGGSIGSELCRQVARCVPKKLIIFDIYENNAYDIEQELRRKYGTSLDLIVEIGSVRERARLEAVFAYYRPEVVFHAAAHKHVPLMEHSNAEAIKNNVLGTYNTADMAEKYGAERFILISSDKAVNPTNVMGASKRMCEMIIQSRTDSDTTFAAVRFGNVLGSNGSVIPLFKRQIDAGGPVTITDKRIIRYFMTIPEASGLVMQAGAMAKRGDLFVLNMGKPVKIYDLAINMIKLSGLTPFEDIDIIETGLRPGEKLYEELLIKTEDLKKTDNDLIFIEHDTPHTRAEIEEKLDVLRNAVLLSEGEISSPRIAVAMRSVVSTFYSPEEINMRAESSEEMQTVNGG